MCRQSEEAWLGDLGCGQWLEDVVIDRWSRRMVEKALVRSGIVYRG